MMQQMRLLGLTMPVSCEIYFICRFGLLFFDDFLFLFFLEIDVVIKERIFLLIKGIQWLMFYCSYTCLFMPALKNW